MCGFALHFVILLFTLCNGVEGKAKQKYELPELLSGAGRFLSDKPHSVDDTSVADETAYITESSDENGKKTKGSYAQHGSDYAEGSELNKKMEAGYDLGPRTFDDFMESQFKHILGAEHIFLPDKRQAKIYKPSRYIQELFSAMLFVDTQTPQVPQERSPMDGPTISSYKSTKGSFVCFFCCFFLFFFVVFFVLFFIYGYSIKGDSSVKIVYGSLLKGGLAWFSFVRKKLTPRRSKFFPYRIDPFQKRLTVLSASLWKPVFLFVCFLCVFFFAWLLFQMKIVYFYWQYLIRNHLSFLYLRFVLIHVP